MIRVVLAYELLNPRLLVKKYHSTRSLMNKKHKLLLEAVNNAKGNEKKL